MARKNTAAVKEAIEVADAQLNNFALPTYTQLLSLLLQGLTTKDRQNLDETLRRNPGATDCGDFVLMTPAAWGAIKQASEAIDA